MFRMNLSAPPVDLQFFNYAYQTHTPPNYKTPPPSKRERTKFSQYQLSWLEKHYETNPYPQGQQREKIALELKLTDVKVQVWFKNRRAKMRQKKKFEEEINRAGNSHISQRSPPQEEIPTTNSTSLTESNTDEEDRFNVPQLDSLSTSLASAAPMSMITLTPMADMSQIKVENIGQYKMENLSQFKVEPLSSNELLQDASTMNLNSFTAPGTSPLEGTATALNSQSTFSNWMNYAATPNLFTQYPPQLSFQSYSPYSASAVGGAPYDYSAFSAAPNYYMNASRQDLAKF